MPNQILQVDENMLETKLDRLVSEKVEQLLNAMLDAEADEITGRVQAFVYAGMQDECGQTRSRASPSPAWARDAGCTPTSVYQWMRRYGARGYWD